MTHYEVMRVLEDENLGQIKSLTKEKYAWAVEIHQSGIAKPPTFWGLRQIDFNTRIVTYEILQNNLDYYNENLGE